MKKYQILYIDPPWKQLKGGIRKSRPKQTRLLDYPTMDFNDIFNLIDNVLIQYCEPNPTIFIWTIDKFLHSCEHKLEQMSNLKRHARIIWDKENGMAPAFTIRYAHEYLLWYYVSPMQKINKDMRGKYTTILREKSIKHSKKPLCAYEMIENLYPNTNKLELFARSKREDWDVWGNEVECDINF